MREIEERERERERESEREREEEQLWCAVSLLRASCAIFNIQACVESNLSLLYYVML